MWAAGLNHFQWFLGVRDRFIGDDLYPRLPAAETTFYSGFMPLSRRLFRAFGLYPSCSDDHLGEYVAYGWEAGEEGYNFEWDESYRVILQELIEAILRGEKARSDWEAPSGEKGAEVIGGILHNHHRWIESGVIYNRGAIANLPFDCAVEVPILVDAAGVHPVVIGNLPDGIARLLAIQVSV